MTTPPTLTSADLARDREICARATALPWIDADQEDCTHYVIDDDIYGPHRFVEEDDYQLLFAARTQLPRYIAELEAAWADESARIVAQAELLKRIGDYFALGGLFNPEMMDHDKVSRLLHDIRDTIEAKPDHPGAALLAELAQSRERVRELGAQIEGWERYQQGINECISQYGSYKP